MVGNPHQNRCQRGKKQCLHETWGEISVTMQKRCLSKIWAGEWRDFHTIARTSLSFFCTLSVQRLLQVSSLFSPPAQVGRMPVVVLGRCQDGHQLLFLARFEHPRSLPACSARLQRWGLSQGLAFLGDALGQLVEVLQAGSQGVEKVQFS